MKRRRQRRIIRYRVTPGTDGQFYTTILADNGEPWFTSEGYTRDVDAHRSIIDFAAKLGVAAVEVDSGT